MAKVSVIVPVYNTSLYLHKCLDSLVNQTLDDIEIILIDDCSSDNSYNILLEYKNKYPNIMLVKNNSNLGTGASRNIGLSISTGEYIGFVDSDDYVSCNMYEDMYNASINYSSDITSVGIKFLCNNEDNSLLTNNYCYQNDLEKNPMQIFWESPSCCNKIFKRDLIDNYTFLEDCYFEDVDLFYVN